MTLDERAGAATTLVYNAMDRLVRVESGAAVLAEYTYAATGQRAAKNVAGAVTHYLHDPGGALYAETDGAGAVIREYITLGGATIAIIDAGGVAYFHNDHLATPQAMTDGAAAVVWDASYRPFGEASIAGLAANARRFPGQTADEETGYHDNWHRTYDPSLGRYLQSDPIGLGGGLNTYAYANGNPVMRADSMGLRGQYGPAALIVAVGRAVGAVARGMGRVGPLTLPLAGATVLALCNAVGPPIIPDMRWSGIPGWSMSGSDDDSRGMGHNNGPPMGPPKGHNGGPPNNPWPIAVPPDWFGDESTWPGWSSTNSQNSWENAADHYYKHHKDFPELNGVDDYVSAANEFVANPPTDTWTKTRANGDILYYDPATNTFAVANSAGVPRTMFRPDEGVLYWWGL